MRNRIYIRASVVVTTILLSFAIAGCAKAKPTLQDEFDHPSFDFTPSNELQILECVDPAIIIDPIQSLQDEEIQILICGLAPHEIIRIEARMQLEPDVYWESSASFIADAQGQVDIASQAPFDGSYETVDPMGLIWSMTRHKAHMAPSDWEWPEPAIVELTAYYQEEPIASASIERLCVNPGIKRIPVRDQGFVGTLYLPPGAIPLPAIIVLSESIDDLSERTAAMLASHGYATLALWYKRGADSPGDLVNVPLEYFETAIKWLSDHQRIEREKLAVMGSSRGGELALLLAATYPDIKAVVALVPSGIVWQGFTAGLADTPAWIHHGISIPYARIEFGDEFERYVTNQLLNSEPIAYATWYLASIESQPTIEEATIPVERIQGPILLISGEEDQMWPSSVFADLVIERLEQHGHPYNYTHINYEGAGHLIDSPYWPTTQIEYRQASTGWLITLGGNAVNNAIASADSWMHILMFFDEHLK